MRESGRRVGGGEGMLFGKGKAILDHGNGNGNGNGNDGMHLEI